MSETIVQSLWIGTRLSVMEQLAIRSFLDHGHPFHLYTYGDVENVPAGTVVRPGTEILPEQEIFCYQSGYGKGSFSAFSNCFRHPGCSPHNKNRRSLQYRTCAKS